MIKNIKAVIFDMDGVIFDSEKIYYDAFFRAAKIHNVEATHDFVMNFSGKTTEACLLILQNYFNNDFEKTQYFFQTWGQCRLDILAQDGLSYKEGFLDLFQAIKQSGRDIGLVTSANRADMTENFERNDVHLLEDFNHIITIEDVIHPKPHPEPYQIMMQHLQRRPDECLVIEDSISGASAATAANAKTIMINEHMVPPAELDEKLFFKAPSHHKILSFLQESGL
ncbi:MAG: HAD family phosphatase [Gammaproteobacteria bacterium]|nr:HAD family phosphatase [Gammaproteobacteria bacterium]